MKKRNNFIFLFFLFSFSSTYSVTLDNFNAILKSLKTNNHYLDKSYKSDLLAFIMINYYNLQLEFSNKTQNNLQMELAYLMAKYGNISIYKAYKIVHKSLSISNSPVQLFRIITNKDQKK